MDPTTVFLTVFLVVALAALAAVLLKGGKVTLKTDSIQFDVKGLLTKTDEAAQEKHLTSDGTIDARTVEKYLQALRRRLPVAKLLWVDDHPINNQKERMALASIGIFSDTYVDNGEALQAFERDDYDVVISDIGRDAGAEDGWDLLRSIRTQNQRIPFIFYTWNITDSDTKKAKKQGANAILERPDELIRTVLESLPKR